MSTPANTDYPKITTELSSYRKDGYVVTVRQLLPIEFEVRVPADTPVTVLADAAVAAVKSGRIKGVSNWDGATPLVVTQVRNAVTGAPVIGCVTRVKA